MSFDLLIPNRAARGDRDEARLRLYRAGTLNTLSLQVYVGGGLVERLGWEKGRPVAIGVGAAGTPDAGKLAVWAAEDGRFKLASPGATAALRGETRALHPSLVMDAVASTAATVLIAEGGRLVLRIPTSFLRSPAIAHAADERGRRSCG